MKRYTAAEAAIELGTDAKTLRRLLRNSPDWTAPGSGGSWSFSTADMPKLRQLVEGKPQGKAKPHTISDDPGLVWSVAMNDPAAVKRLTEERVDRLEAALKAKGLHISQIRERDTFRPLTPQAV